MSEATLTADLFPETLPGAPQREHRFCGQLVDTWGYPRVTVRLVGLWSAQDAGWRVGWLAQLDRAVDEWHPANESKHLKMPNYPWYRLPELPRSRQFDVAAAAAGRAVKIVLEQMIQYTDDAGAIADARALSETIDAQARAWLIGS